MIEELDQQLFQLQLRCRKNVDHLLSGKYRSVFKGRGLEFDELRPYEPGDDVRAIDWNVTARTSFPFIKRYHEERDCTIMFIVDLSDSCTFSSTRKSRRELITEFCAHMAFAALRNNDTCGLLLFSDEVEAYIPPVRGKSGIMRILRELMSYSPRSQGTSIQKALEFFGNVRQKRSIVFLLSDFQDKGYEEELSIVGIHHELIGVSIGDQREKKLKNAGLVSLKQSEGGEHYVVDLSRKENLTRYMNRQRGTRDERKRLFHEMGSDYVELSTESNLVEDIMAFFHERERRTADESGG